ncbi:MAG: ribbon-helix-helix protein, CopG family [Archaeoglobaceae archaeon]|nr:ribbon-helix-helix protein, CopG family [Archaeoglobaceae archaeon]MDW8118932.1 ribbon-helix-helix protein, CopG family [Archaeoglobaceae archaeon]
MKNPVRVTVALDEKSLKIMNEIRGEFESQSELIREVLRFYYEFREIRNLEKEIIMRYIEMLSNGEHVVLDIDHFIALMKFLGSHPEKEQFWEIHKDIARAHADEFAGKDLDYVLRRLEACNLFRLNTKNGEYTLVLNSELLKTFVKSFLEVVLPFIGYRVEIKEEFMKLRVRPFQESELV